MLSRAAIPLLRSRGLYSATRLATTTHSWRGYAIKQSGTSPASPKVSGRPAASQRFGAKDSGSSTNNPNISKDGDQNEHDALSKSTDTSRKNESGKTASEKQNTSPRRSVESSESSIGSNRAQSGSDEAAKPLPDLTHGIPSTIAMELARLDTKSTASANITKPIGGSGRRPPGQFPDSTYESSIDRRRNRLYGWMYFIFLLGGAIGTIYLGRNWESESEEKKHPDTPSGWGIRLFWKRIKARLADYTSYYRDPTFPKLLPDPDPSWAREYTLVLSLEDFLVHSQWSRENGWRTAKRPGVDYFIRYLSQYYELVVFTSVPIMMADPVIRKLDPFRFIMWPLGREATRYNKGEYIKDLSHLNRDLSKVILIDTVPSHGKLQPENAIILPKWQGNVDDRELVKLIPFLEYVATMGYTDVREVLKSFEGAAIPEEFARREKLLREKFEKELADEEAKKPKHAGISFLGSILGIKPAPLTMDGVEPRPENKMLIDVIRERGQKQYEAMENEIKANGAKFLAELEAEEKKAQEEMMKGYRQSVSGMFSNWGKQKGEKLEDESK